jgi:hypothetical protein
MDRMIEGDLIATAGFGNSFVMAHRHAGHACRDGFFYRETRGASNPVGDEEPFAEAPLIGLALAPLAALEGHFELPPGDALVIREQGRVPGPQIFFAVLTVEVPLG